MVGLVDFVDLIELVGLVGLLDLVSEMSWGLREKPRSQKDKICCSRKTKHSRLVGLVCLVRLDGFVDLVGLVDLIDFG